MKIDFSKVIFTDKSRMTFDGSDWWAKGRILSNSDMSVAKRRQQRGDSAMILPRIVNQTIIGPFKIDEGFKLNRAIDCNFMNKTFFVQYPVTDFESEVCIYARQSHFSFI